MTSIRRAMILAAGHGSRLGELGRIRPKPMLPVCGTPLVRWAVLWLRDQGVREFVINLHHLGEQIEAELRDGSDLGVAIAYSREQGLILGTGGGLRHARALLDDGHDSPFVVVNGKILVELQLDQVLSLHRRRGAEATMVVRDDADAERWGGIGVAQDDRVVRLLEHRVPGVAPVATSMFTGIHVMHPRFLDRVPSEGEQCIIRTAYRSLLDGGDGLFAYRTAAYWWEHSTVERYLAGVRNVLEGKVALPYAERALRGIDPSAAIDARAKIEHPVWIGRRVVVGAGASVGPYAQLGDGCVVEPGVRIENAVVWDGVRVATDACGVVRVE